MTQQNQGLDSPAVTAEWQLADAILRLPGDALVTGRPEEFLEYVADALEELLSVRVEISWADVDVQPPLPAMPHMLRLKVKQQDVPYATIDVLSATPLAQNVRFALEHLAADLTFHVDALTMRRMRRVLRELRSAMASSADLESITHAAVEVAVRHMDAEAAILLLSVGGDLRQVAAVGEWSDDPTAVAQVSGAARVGIEALAPMAHADWFVTVPISSSLPARMVLVLKFSPLKQTHSLTFPVLAEMASVAAPFLDAKWRDRVFMELLELNRASEETSTAEMYRRVLATALRLVPGADSGTLLTRTDPAAPFKYQAAVGFALDQLVRQPVSEESARAWYGQDDAGWLNGEPRILCGADTDIDRLGMAASPGTDPEPKLYDQIKATLCLPVLRDGKVMAVLNLDNLSEAGEFGPDSVQLAKLFGAPLASLLHRQNSQDLLRRAALTDELTGLANRRAFNEALARELQRALRSGPGPSVLHMDLKSFKAVNDAYGHEVGDQVLLGVADAIRANIRNIDVAARYGGDEFMGLLVDTPKEAALKVAARIRAAVAHLDVGLGSTRIDIGVASYEADGREAAELIRLADQRMYAAKQSAL